VAVGHLSPPKLRLLGLLPLAFFFAQGLHYWQIEQLGQMLWMCNIGSLILAVGMFLEKPVLIRLASIWMIPGVVVWFIYYAMPTWNRLPTGQFSYVDLFGLLTSTLTHVGGFVVGMIALRWIGMDRLAWLYAFGWYFVLQLFTRLLTPADWNVNLAHKVQPGFEQTFTSYFKFWLVLTVTTGVCLWLLGFLLQKLWPVTTLTCSLAAYPASDGN
jgi:hypothetical protein